MTTSRILVVMALAEESQGIFEEHAVPILYTGVGKVNATYYLTKRLMEQKFADQKNDLVLNLGTVGSSKLPAGSLILCNKFVQRDMDVTVLGFQHGETPYETTFPITLEHANFPIVELLSGICGTGDSFDSLQPKIECDVVDMEAYALAKVCLMENIPFMSVKYVANGINETGGKEWEEALMDGAKKLYKFYESFSSVKEISEKLEEKQESLSNN